jgi:HPt (histidine-containing phosphotransfer) domain-containing protein
MTDPQILDTKALDRLREWGGEKLLAQMVRLFLENAPQRMAQVRLGAGEGDVKEAERGAHSLKSSAANLGAQRVRNLAADAERAASAGDREAVATLLPDLEEAFSQVIQALESVEKGMSR